MVATQKPPQPRNRRAVRLTYLMKHILTLLAAASLGACALNPAPHPAAAPSASTLAYLTQPLSSTSVFREGDMLNFAVFSYLPTAKVMYRVQLSASCKAGKGWLNYLDIIRRVYPFSVDGLYASPRELKPGELELLRKNPSFIQACASTPTPQWHQVGSEQDGRQTYVDSASLVVTGNIRQAWVLDDFADEHPTLPFMAPVAQSRSHLMIDCARKNFTALISYDLDADNQVTQRTPDSTRVAVAVADFPAYRPVFDAVCGSPQALAQLPGYVARVKPPAQIQHLDIQPEVADAIDRLALPAPHKALHYLHIIGTSTTAKGTEAVDEQQFIDTDPATGQLAISRRADQVRSTRASFRGLLNLTAHAHGQSVTGWDETSGLLNIAFTGDWVNLPIGASLALQYDATDLNSQRHYAGPVHVRTECTVQSELPASQVNAQLTGKAKLLACHWPRDAYKRSFTFQYLEDYGFFFENHMDNHPGSSFDRYLHVAR